MKKLLRYLSPFAPDQSGACGVLYELGGLIVICDAGGCAGNICGFDEPRWFTKRSAVFSAGLRDMDAIMGRDDKLIAKLASAQESLGGKFTAIVATPVPAVIGTDMKALKRMAEKKTGVPCITVNAIGTKYYDEGESEAWEKLFREFARARSVDGTLNESDSGNSDVGRNSDVCGNSDADRNNDAGGNSVDDENGVNSGNERTEFSDFTGVIGATPLETGYSTPEPLMRGLEKYGIDNPVIYSMGTGLEEIKSAGKARRNLVVSAAGIAAAEYMKEEFGIPYETGYPFIPEEVTAEARKVKDGKVLIVHSQFAANELRRIIREEGNAEVDCGTFFMLNEKYSEENDIKLAGEDELWELAVSGTYDVIIADDDIKRLLDAAGFKGRFISFSHFAVSGRTLDEGKTLYDLNMPG